MKIRLLSDLHLEFSEFVLNYYGEDILILAGDICSEHKTIINLIKQYIKTYDTPVILVLGNHDFWHDSLRNTRQLWKEPIKNLYVLDNNTVKIGDILFIGTTLWTDANKEELELASMCIADFRYIEDMSAGTWQQEHKRAINFLRKICEENKNERKVVITHHLPSYKSIDPKFKGHFANPAFANRNLEEFILGENIELFLHGHTHRNCDYMLGETRVICNPRGYVSIDRIENPEFKPKLVIEI